MKFTFKPSPNFRQAQSTQSIMRDLTIGLLVIFGFTLTYYFTEYGANYALRAVSLMLTSVVCATLTEVIFFKCMKQDIKLSLQTSFPWVTAIILTLMCSINVTYYALAISTIIAVVFGKLVFGGFGQNIFNPAAVGRSIIFASFAGSVSADVITGATPTAALAGSNWLVTSSSEGLSNLFLGLYPGAMGETSFLLIALVGAFLAYRKVIDYRVPVTYITTLFLLATVYGMMNGQGIEYGLYHIAIGGAMFGAVFMMTDPVTNPTCASGRILFAVGCAILTIVIRLKANLPEGVLYSILLMNMMTPTIEKFMDGKQTLTLKKNVITIAIVFMFGILSVVACSFANNAQADEVVNNTNDTYEVSYRV